MPKVESTWLPSDYLLFPEAWAKHESPSLFCNLAYEKSTQTPSFPFFSFHKDQARKPGSVWYFFMMPLSSSCTCLTWSLTSTYIEEGVYLCLCLKPTGSTLSIWCLTVDVCPMSNSPLAKIFMYCSQKEWPSLSAPQSDYHLPGT